MSFFVFAQHVICVYVTFAFLITSDSLLKSTKSSASVCQINNADLTATQVHVISSTATTRQQSKQK